MATQLSVVNRVLRRLRESQVTSVAQTEYATLIAEFVNEAMTLIQEHHDWSALEREVTFDIVANQAIYDLSRNTTDGGDADDSNARLPNQKSYLLWNQTGWPQAWYHIDGDSPEKQQFTVTTEALMHKLRNENPDMTARYPTYLSLRINDAGTGWQATMYNTPETDGTVTMKWWIPQEEFALDGTDNNTDIIVRPDLVFAYALRAALNERGEEMGEPGNMADQRFLAFLSAAAETDLMNRSRADRYEFYLD